tara:strand:+ start:556 stop:1011 length:456 start_codon:yes stop_codon:yes gene_type:complete
MSRVFYKHGNAAIGVSDELERLVNQLLDANPIIKRTMQDAVEEIYKEAKKEWPVRVQRPRQKGGVAKKSPLSQDSKNKLERGIMITSNELVAFVRNTAPYAWAIKTGQYTLNDLAFGTRTSNELLWKPMRSAANKLVDVLADDLINQAKKR